MIVLIIGDTILNFVLLDAILSSQKLRSGAGVLIVNLLLVKIMVCVVHMSLLTFILPKNHRGAFSWILPASRSILLFHGLGCGLGIYDYHH